MCVVAVLAKFRVRNFLRLCVLRIDSAADNPNHISSKYMYEYFMMFLSIFGLNLILRSVAYDFITPFRNNGYIL